VSRIAPVVCPILVGRDELLALAERRIRDVADGHGHVLLLSGDAGIGKTRLLGSILRHAGGAGFRASIGGLTPQDQDVPEAILLDLGRAMRRVAALAPAGDQLVEVLARPGVEGPAEPTQRRRMRVLDLVDVLADAAGEPTLLAFEDLHWADDLSLEVLGSLARRVADVPLLVVATVRADEAGAGTRLGAWRARLLTQRLAEEARLTRLGPDATAVMARVLLEGRSLPEDAIQAIHERTDGIPLHIEELVGMLADRNVASAEDVRASGVPDSIEATVLERLRHRSEDARAIARAGAVVGRRFLPAIVGRVLDRPEAELGEPLDELVEHAFLEPAGRSGEFDFRNQLVRDAIYGAIPIAERRRLHGLVGELAGEPGVGSEIHASGHFELAGRTADAHRTALAGARAAAAISAHREAMELYRRAVRNLPDRTGPTDRGAILEELAAEESSQDESVAAAATLERAREAYVEAGDRLAAARGVATLAVVRHLLGDGLDVVRPLLEGALAGLGDLEGDDVDRVRARLEAALGAAFSRALDLPATEAHAARSIELAERLGDVATEINGRVTQATVRPFEGHIDETIRIALDAIERCRELHLDDEAGRAYRIAGSGLSEVFAYDAAERMFRDGITFAERHELWNHRCYMTAHLGLVLWGTGRWVEADDVASAALREGRGGVTTQITGRYVRGYVALGEGRLADAEAHLAESLALGERSGDILRISLPLWGLAETALLGGRVEQAVALSERGLTISAAVADGSLLAPFLVTGTRARLAADGSREAAAWVDAVGRIVTDSGVPTLRPALDHGLGLVALANGETGRARAHLADAIRGWDRVGRTWEATWARLDAGVCHLRARRAGDAVELFGEARAVADSLGSRPLAERAAELLRDARGRSPIEERWAPLTAREFDVARLISAGLTNGEIATELSIAPKTVASHVEHILAKLGAARRAEIAAWAAGRTPPAVAAGEGER
jgi:DNA-binding CsgD family transcriptional regulator